MSDCKFTPGPWVAGWAGGKTGPTCPAPMGPTCAGKDWGYMPVGYGTETVAIAVQQDRKGDLAANAHLIAAAPDMYAVLHKLVADAEQGWFEDWLEAKAPSGDCETVESKWKESSDYSEFAYELKEAKAALAKARGES